MQDKKGHIKAFTLMDMLAGMVIMTIVITMVFGVLNSVNKQTIDFQKLRVELNDFMLMESDINRELDESKAIFEIPNGFVLEQEEGELKYSLNGTNLLRESPISVDTLHRQVKSLKFNFAANAADGKYIQGIEIKTSLRNQELTAHFFKSRDNRNSINQELLHGI